MARAPALLVRAWCSPGACGVSLSLDVRPRDPARRDPRVDRGSTTKRNRRVTGYSKASPNCGSGHWRFTSSLPRECALARTRAKVGPWRVVEGVTALLRRNGLAEQAGEEVGSPKSRRRAAGCTAPKKQAQGSRLHGAQPWGPPKPRKTQPGLPRKAATARAGWVGPTRRLRARAQRTLGAGARVPTGVGGRKR